MELQLKKVLFDRLVVIGGTEYREDFVQRSVFFDVSPPAPGTPRVSSTYNWGAYLQADAAVLTNVHVNAGFRYDQYGHVEPTVNPRLALIYNPWANTTLKAIGGQAFRAPNFFERAFNGNLVPERITTGELDWEQGLGKNLSSSVSGYYNQIDHLINFQGGTYENVDGATAKGCEFELQGWWASGFRGRVSYALQNTEFHQPGVVRSEPPELARLAAAAGHRVGSPAS
jgi:iron complex outermembrane receptor protein